MCLRREVCAEGDLSYFRQEWLNFLEQSSVLQLLMLFLDLDLVTCGQVVINISEI